MTPDRPSAWAEHLQGDWLGEPGGVGSGWLCTSIRHVLAWPGEWDTACTFPKGSWSRDVWDAQPSPGGPGHTLSLIFEPLCHSLAVCGLTVPKGSHFPWAGTILTPSSQAPCQWPLPAAPVLVCAHTWVSPSPGPAVSSPPPPLPPSPTAGAWPEQTSHAPSPVTTNSGPRPSPRPPGLTEHLLCPGGSLGLGPSPPPPLLVPPFPLVLSLWLQQQLFQPLSLLFHL